MSRKPRELAGRLARSLGHGLLAAIVLGTAALGACKAPTPATVNQLAHRAAFDLRCPASDLQIYEIDERTRGVTGCGRQQAYVETCDGGREPACVWLADATTATGQTVQHFHQATVVMSAEPARSARSPAKLYSLDDK